MMPSVRNIKINRGPLPAIKQEKAGEPNIKHATKHEQKITSNQSKNDGTEDECDEQADDCLAELSTTRGLVLMICGILAFLGAVCTMYQKELLPFQSGKTNDLGSAGNGTKKGNSEKKVQNKNSSWNPFVGMIGNTEISETSESESDSVENSSESGEGHLPQDGSKIVHGMTILQTLLMVAGIVVLLFFAKNEYCRIPGFAEHSSVGNSPVYLAALGCSFILYLLSCFRFCHAYELFSSAKKKSNACCLRVQVVSVLLMGIVTFAAAYYVGVLDEQHAHLSSVGHQHHTHQFDVENGQTGEHGTETHGEATSVTQDEDVDSAMLWKGGPSKQTAAIIAGGSGGCAALGGSAGGGYWYLKKKKKCGCAQGFLSSGSESPSPDSRNTPPGVTQAPQTNNLDKKDPPSLPSQSSLATPDPEPPTKNAGDSVEDHTKPDPAVKNDLFKEAQKLTELERGLFGRISLNPSLYESEKLETSTQNVIDFVKKYFQITLEAAESENKVQYIVKEVQPHLLKTSLQVGIAEQCIADNLLHMKKDWSMRVCRKTPTSLHLDFSGDVFGVEPRISFTCTPGTSVRIDFNDIPQKRNPSAVKLRWEDDTSYSVVEVKMNSSSPDAVWYKLKRTGAGTDARVEGKVFSAAELEINDTVFTPEFHEDENQNKKYSFVTENVPLQTKLPKDSKDIAVSDRIDCADCGAVLNVKYTTAPENSNSCTVAVQKLQNDTKSSSGFFTKKKADKKKEVVHHCCNVCAARHKN